MSISEKSQKEIEAKRRAQIRKAAKKLFYMRGFSGTSVDAIAAQANVSKGLIYHYFKNKEAILFSFDEDMEIYLNDLQKRENPYMALVQFGLDFLVNDESKYEQAPPVQILLTTFANHELDIDHHKQMNPILKDFGREYLGNFFQRGIQEGIFKNGNAKVFGDIYWSFLMGKLLPIKKGNESENAAIYVDEILSIFRRA